MFGGLSECNIPQSLCAGVFPASAWQKISNLERSAALILSSEELPTPLNNCSTIPVSTRFSFRDNSLRSRRCCGGYRRALRPRPAVYRCGGFRADTIRPYQIPGKPCRGGYHPPAVSHRSLGVAELHAGTCDRTLVQRWLEVVASSNESSGRERSEVLATHRLTAPQNQIKNVSFPPGAAHFLSKQGSCGSPAKRVPWEKDEQRNERVFAPRPRRKRAI